MISNNGKFNEAEKKEVTGDRSKMKATDFLMPSERKYPYKTKGQISCNLLKAAMSRSAQYGETEVHSKATKLYADHCE